VRDGVLVLNTMLWPDEVREASFDFLEENFAPRRQELEMAASLIESMAGDFNPDEYTDEYRVALQAVIDAKVTGQEVVAPPEVEEAPTGAIDLMAALRASVERARAARGGPAPAPSEHEPVPPTPITAAKSAKSAKAAGATEEAPARPAKKAPARKAVAAAEEKPAKATRAPAKAAKATKSTQAPAKAAKKAAPRARRTA
jgi:DNA end-binding protein Ku